MTATLPSALERRSPEGGIDSVQRIALEHELVATTDTGARELGARYFAELECYSRGLVRARHGGGEIALVLAGAVTLFRFASGQALVDDAVVECRFPILGGLLVARAGGFFAVAQRSDPAPELGLSVIGYHPRLGAGSLRPVRRLVYSTVQRPLHLAVSHRFLTNAARNRP